MKFFNFHLMPYRHADLDAIGRNGSAWVTFSNRHYEPQKGAELYHEYLDQMELADKLGFDGVCLNEHHQTAYGMMPFPAFSPARSPVVSSAPRSPFSAARCR
jgi:alkanesulfonate monooxygenase SsuD/methylene tetrahydromethanopterin reductase-like flavin-dependent oxidoreductase (luciferase family)